MFSKYFYFIKKIFFNVCLFMRESGRGCAERGSQRIWSIVLSYWQQRAWRGAWTHEPWDHDLSWRWMLNQLIHVGTAILSFFLNVYLFGESMCESVRGAQREEELQAVSTGSAEPYLGCVLMKCEIMTWAEIKSWMLDWATQVLPFYKYLCTQYGAWTHDPEIKSWHALPTEPAKRPEKTNISLAEFKI